MKKILISMVILLSFVSMFCSAKSGDVNYNTVVKFSKGEHLKFSGFTLEFAGTRDEKKEFPNGNSLNFRFYDFKVSNDRNQKNISWSSGTGDIAPLKFDFEGSEYQIELSYSEKLKTKLSENELVIVK